MALSFEEQKAKMQKAPLRRGGGNWIQGEGLFEVEVISTLRKMGWNENFTARTKELFIAEFKIISVESTSDAVLKAHPPGSTASWTCKDPSEGGCGDVKNFCLAVTGTDPRSVKDSDEELQNLATLLCLAAMGEAEAFKQLEQPENFFIGQKLRLETKTIKTKAGKDFTKHTWSPSEADR